MASEATIPVKFEKPKHVNQGDDLKPFTCHCGRSSRFTPLYGFNTSGVHPQLLIGNGVVPMIQCADCKQVFEWSKPSAEGEHDGGWIRSSLFNELERIGG